MSYILEALRKAERERNLGQAPGLADVAQTAPPPVDRTRRLPLVLGALTLLLASALLWSLLRRPPATPAAASAPVTAAPSPGLTTPIQSPAATAAVEASENLATLDDLVPAPAEPALAPAPAAVAQPAPSAAIIAAAPTREPPIPEPLPAPADVLATPAAEETQVGTLQLDSAPTAGVKKLGDMPASFRAEFPRLIVDVHASNADSRRRFVLINGRRYKETEALPEGPVIVEIPDGGIVFDYRGERVMVPLSR